MKIVHINTFPNKATGTIMMSIHNQLLELGEASYAVWGRGRDSESHNEFTIRDDLGIKLHGIYTRITDKTGFLSQNATRKLLAKMDEIKPDIVHLHNIHGYYLNIEMLFKYINKNQIKVVWTFHDCWPFTGHCAYFDMAGCNKWIDGCFNCPQKNTYPASKLLDNSKWNWKKKKEIYANYKITIVTPSEWLKKIVEKSFLGQNSIRVIHNGIDFDTFRPVLTNFSKKYNLNGKIVILGVASEWTERKGLKDFVTLSKLLDKYKYQIVLVGLSPQQIKNLPASIIGIEKTSNIHELVGIYSRADIFFNPTYDDNFPTTN